MNCKRCDVMLTHDDHKTKNGWVNKPTVCMKCKSTIGAKARKASFEQAELFHATRNFEDMLNSVLAGGLVLKKDEEDEEVE